MGLGAGRFLVAPWFTALAASGAVAAPLDRSRISCEVDKSAITQQGNDWTVRTSRNDCPGGFFA